MYFFHAACRIEPGAELTFAYIWPFHPSSIRLGMLASQYKFHCSCPCCSLGDNALVASDERRKNMQVLEKRIATVLASSPSEQQVGSALQDISSLTALIDEEMGGNPKLKARAYYGGLQMSLAAECAEEAQEMLDKLQQQSLMTVGEDGNIFESLGIVAAGPDEGPSEAEDSSQISMNVELKKRFRALPRRSGDAIDARGLKELLQQGRSTITEKEALALFNLVRKDSDGNIKFDELVDLLYPSA